MSVLQTRCSNCSGSGWAPNRRHYERPRPCPVCEGWGMIDTMLADIIDAKGTEPMTDIKKTIRKSTTVTTTVMFDSNTVEKILAQAAGAPERDCLVEIDEYSCTAKVTWTTTETETDDPVLTTRELAEKAVKK